MKVPPNLKYTKTHEWVLAQGDTATVGITDHAQHELTDIVYVELPGIGTDVTAGKECAVVESVKAASDIYAPLSGEVVAVNEELTSAPQLINDDAFGKGWLFKLRMTDASQLGDLLSADDYAHHIGA
jgi:glycine cleavage system H protein